MLTALSISIPFFALIFLGSGLRHWRFLDAAATRTLSRFAFYIVMPPFVFLKIASQPPQEIWNLGFILRYELVTALLFVLAYPLGWLLRLSVKERGMLGLNMAYPNYGYIGVPLSILAFGDQAALPMALILFGDTVVLIGLTVLYVVLGAPKDSSQGESVGHSPWLMLPQALLKNPLLLAALLGMCAAYLELHFPPPLANLLSMLAGAAAPVALVALGASLAPGVLRASAGQMSIITTVKLVLHPLLVAAVFLFWPGQERVWIQTAILCAALPVAANVFVLSDHYGAFQQRSATAIMLTTIVATATVPLVLYALLQW